ncbi:MAG TPA: fructosamine kinase family protein [Thiobacillaceae bacterium]|nr:fructosamine kinase family protein [Thiobacillaceae bacterium]HNU65279.1 fructosamine kinase family protein [Thiobacillaceae bacterium]
MSLHGALDATVSAAIGANTEQAFVLARKEPAAGGCINRSQTLLGRDGRRFFLKLNKADHAAMFAAEAEGLAELDRAGAIRVPRPIAHGVTGGEAWLALEHLDLAGGGNGAELGRRLAALHRVSKTHFGWHRDNTIGATPQVNAPAQDWVGFYRDRRLKYQLDLAQANGASHALLANGERLLADLPAFFSGYAPVPSLLHGDLWSGNHGYADGEPVLFDPAVYYGDRETDLAMTELFGGFPRDFYAAYRQAWPLDPGYTRRRDLYNLYHVLNHYNLFGGGYGGQAAAMLEHLLAEIR